MTRVLKAGSTMADFSFTKPPAKRLKELGFDGVVGYISHPPSNPAKNITRAQIKSYLDAGLGVLLVFELNAERPDKGGAYGALDGKSAANLAKALGYPESVPILIAVDTNTVPANKPSHIHYCEQFEKACKPYPVGVYGDTDILSSFRSQIGWVPNAWSWSNVRSRAELRAKSIASDYVHVIQLPGYHIDNQWAIDPNDVIKDIPVWGTWEVEKPAPPNPEKPTIPVGVKVLPIINSTGDPYNSADNYDGYPAGVKKWVLLDSGEIRHIEEPEFLARGGKVTTSLPGDVLDKLPRYSKQANPGCDFRPMEVILRGTAS